MSEISKMLAKTRKNFKKGVREPEYEIDEIKEIMLPVTDGTKLQTILCFPSGEGPWPVLFSRTPYSHIEPYYKGVGEEYAKRGYVFVFQFCRGNNKSEGEWEPNVNERSDGIDSINWLAEQEWCQGIGIHGVSYMALTGWIIADQLPDKVKALYLCHYGVDRYLSAYKDGLFRHDILTGWAMGNAGKKITNDFKKDYIKSALYRPHVNVDEDLWGIKLKWYKDWVTNTDYDSEYWQTGFWKMLKDIPGKIDIPTCIVAGWFDHHLEGTILGYELLNDEVKNHSSLLIGAWNHDFEPCIPAHHHQNAARNMDTVMFNWFEKTLIEDKLPESGVETYIVGDDKWKKWDSLAIEYDYKKIFFLRGDKFALEGNLKILSLLEVEQSRNTVIEYRYDPDDPVYTRGGETNLVSSEQRGSVLQEEPGYRQDVISFLSGELKEGINISGKINIKLFVSSDCEDTCFTAKIIEVLPDGRGFNIRSSITTMAYRNKADKRTYYIPNEIEEINIEMLPITWHIQTGSRLRIDISSSNFPEYAIHSNYKGVWSLQDKVKVAHQKLYIGEEYPSLVEIPVIK